MNKINIQFGGITNTPDDNFSNDGDMAVLVNIRHKGGELVQCQPPTVDSVSKVQQAMYHAQSGRWIELLKDGVMQFRNEDGREEQFTKLDKIYVSFAIMGNIIVLYLEGGVEYAIWRNGDFVYLGELPEVPRLRASGLEELTISRTTEERYYNKYIAEKKDLYYRAVQKGFIDELLDEVYEKCGYVDRAWFKVALRLFDGSYIAVSGVYQLSSRRTGQDDVIGKGALDLWEPKEEAAESSFFDAKLNYFIPEIEVDAIPDSWRDLIVSVDVFSTGSIMSFQSIKERGKRGEKLFTDAYEVYRIRTTEELKNAMVDAEFYKVAEFDINGELMWKIENTSPSNIAVQKRLEDIQVHTVKADKSYVYNSRLHCKGANTLFFKGFPPSYSYDSVAWNRTWNSWTVVVYIDTWEGERCVIYKESDEQQHPDLLFFFSYPDARAKRMEIYSKIDDTLKVLKLPLVAHKTRDEAYFLETEYHMLIPAVKSDFTWTTEDKIPTEVDNMDVQPNVLKVSAVDNPFYFPTAQTYKFEGDIVGLASNAEAISTGQFGQYPLFIFTDKGIWAMQVDATGQGAYVSQSPFSREVCSGAICPVSGGIVFTTERGVMAISGGQVTEISASLDGLNTCFMEYQEALWEKIFEKAGYNAYIAPLPIREYIKGAKLAYNYLYNEVILSNPVEEYSYVYNLSSGTWGVIDVVFDVTTNKYPELVVYDNKNSRTLTFKEGNNKNAFVAITRPVKAGTLDFKRLRQAALRCTFEGGLNFYVLGSNDGAMYSCITGKEYDGGTQRDLVTSMSRSKQYKYFAIAVAGNMEGRISLAELLVDAGFAGNQLR